MNLIPARNQRSTRFFKMQRNLTFYREIKLSEFRESFVDSAPALGEVFGMEFVFKRSIGFLEKKEFDELRYRLRVVHMIGFPELQQLFTVANLILAVLGIVF